MKEYLEKQLTNTNYWLSFAEAKNAALVVLNFSVIAFLSDMTNNKTITAVFMIVFVASLIICLLSFFPNVSNKPSSKKASNKMTDVNLLFYGDIANFDKPEDLLEAIKNKYFGEDDENLKDTNPNIHIDLASEIIINSQITVNKLRIFKIALKIDLAAFAVLILSIIVA